MGAALRLLDSSLEKDWETIRSLDIRARGEDCASIPAEERPVRQVRLATWDPLNESEGEISGGTTSAKVCLYSLHKAPFRVPSPQNLS